EASHAERMAAKEATWAAAKQDLESEIHALSHDVDKMLGQLDAAKAREKQREEAMAAREEAQRRLQAELSEAGKAIAGVMAKVESAARGERAEEKSGRRAQ